MNALAFLREIPLAEAEARIADWAERGLILYSEIDTQSTKTRRLELSCQPQDERRQT